MTPQIPHRRLLHEQRDHVAILSFSAPPAGDRGEEASWRWTPELAEDAVERCHGVENDPTWAIALLAEAGLPPAPDDPPALQDRRASAYGRLVAAVGALQRPTVVGLAGEAAGAGLGIVLACDLRILAADALLAWPELRRGGLPTSGNLVRLARLVGPRILEALLATDGLGADDAFRLGLVAEVVPAELLRTRTLQVAEELASKGPQALRAIKEAFYRGRDLTLTLGTEVEVDLSMILQTTRDRMEGVRSFLDRRQPQYLGR